jgi:hypothetical protein
MPPISPPTCSEGTEARHLALDEHLEQRTELICGGHEDRAGAAFFDFRCADLAVGSGHFLVAAVDHIEKRLAELLDEHAIPAVEAEPDRLRAAAIGHLRDSSTGYEIERRQPLRRLVARRCVYGVDRNQIAVELAGCRSGSTRSSQDFRSASSTTTLFWATA